MSSLKQRNIHLVYLILFLTGISWLSYSQVNTRFKHLNIQDGLSHSTVFSLLQDDKGFMWFGTQDAGLNRYDGYDVIVYTHNPEDSNSIGSNNVSKIAKDKKGYLWIGTWGGGLDRFDPSSEIFYHYRSDKNKPGSLSHENAQTVFCDSKGTIWVGTAGGGLNKLDEKSGRFTVYRHDEQNENSISHDRVWDIDEDREGNLWIGTSDGLCKLNTSTGKFTRFMFSENKTGSISNPKVRTVFIDHLNNVWIGTSNGICILNSKTGLFENYIPYPNDAKTLETNEVNIIHEDRFGRKWIGTIAGGLLLFNEQTKQFDHFLNDQNDISSLSYNDVRDIGEDRSGILWASTRGGGINLLDLKPAKFDHLEMKKDEPNSLQSNRIKSIFAGKDGIIWIGTDGGGLSKYNKNSNVFEHYKYDAYASTTISNNRIKTVYQDKIGNIWVGTDGSSLNCIDAKSGKVQRISADPKGNKGPADEDIFCITGADYNNLWIGTKEGLDYYDAEKKTFTHYRNNPDDKNSISNNRILSLHLDRKGLLWIGTDDGLNSFSLSTLKFKTFKNDFDNKNSISNNDIYCINEDVDGGLWFGTGNGLNFFNPSSEKFSYYSDRQGLPGNPTYSIQNDSLGYLWIGTVNGLKKFDRSQKTFRHYFRQDGLQSSEFNPGSSTSGKDGFLYFGGNNGLNFFNPQQVKNNPYIPEIAFTGFYLFKKLVGIDEDSPLKKSISHTNAITLSSSQSDFGFTFAAFNYNLPEENEYRYIMKGFDKNWINAHNKREVNYTNLSPGTYTFSVMAANNDGLWNEKGISIQIIITPPFWKTMWFYGLCTIIIGGLVWLLIKWREKSLKREKKILEQKVESRTEHIKKQNKELEIQKEELAEMNKDITDSIRYAKLIQEAILPSTAIVEQNLKNHFVLYRPKSIVSGDFYWTEQFNEYELGEHSQNKKTSLIPTNDMTVKGSLNFETKDIVLVAAVDCTGHGVPGALVSIIGSNGLHRAVNEFGLFQPNTILETLNELVIESLRQKETEMKDGMDISLCSINWKTKEVNFSGANNPLYIVSKNQNKFPEDLLREKNNGWCLFEIKGDKQPIGGIKTNKKVFTNHKFILEDKEAIYLFSDGYPDQFGGPKGKKFKYSQLREILVTIQDEEMEDQKNKLNEEFDKWRGNLEQVDDICIIGIRME